MSNVGHNIYVQRVRYCLVVLIVENPYELEFLVEKTDAEVALLFLNKTWPPSP